MEKKFKITTYFVEPARYTLDLIENVHKKSGFKYRFLFSKSLASKKIIKGIKQNGFLEQLRILKNDFYSNDLIIFNGFYNRELWFLFLLCLLSKKKVFLGLESDTMLKPLNKNPLIEIVKKTALSILFNNSYVYGFPGGFGSHVELFKKYGMAQERIVTLPMVINNSKFIPNSRKNKPFTFLFVGRFVKLKNIELIIESFLNLNLENTLLNLVGEGEVKKQLEIKYKSKNKKVNFLGSKYDDELKDEYQKSNCLILASKSEQWGFVINEAMASGLPVISSRFVGANYDLIEGKGTGLIFDPEKEGDLIQKMQEMYCDTIQYEKFSENAYNFMHNYWNYDLYKKQLLLSIEKMKNA